MYRAAHTLAGIAGTVGLAAIKHLGHALELALVRRNHAADRDSLEAFETVRQAIAELALMLADVAREHEPEPIPSLLDGPRFALPPNWPLVEKYDEAAAMPDEAQATAEFTQPAPDVVPPPVRGPGGRRPGGSPDGTGRARRAAAAAVHRGGN
jgi:chemosensory pili system protein ChpA (sensor histidine kinase/response regulator)